jgi:hypothetical protein
MKYLLSTVLAASFALSSVPALAINGQGPDIEASTQLTMKECLAMQAAKHDGASRDDMKRACNWTTDENGTNYLSSGERPRAVDAAPYGLPPSALNPPP